MVFTVVTPDLTTIGLHVDVVVVVLAVVAVHTATFPQPALESRLLRWFGVVSYGLYLWHSIFVWKGWEVAGVPSPWPAVAVSLAVTSLSWRFVEEPVLQRERSGRGLPRHRPPVKRAMRPGQTSWDEA